MRSVCVKQVSNGKPYQREFFYPTNLLSIIDLIISNRISPLDVYRESSAGVTFTHIARSKKLCMGLGHWETQLSGSYAREGKGLERQVGLTPRLPSSLVMVCIRAATT